MSEDLDAGYEVDPELAHVSGSDDDDGGDGEAVDVLLVEPPSPRGRC